MILYHFTALEYLADIRRDGLTRGQVTVTQSVYRNAIWLTTNPDPAGGHGLSEGRYWTEAERRAIYAPASLRLVRLDKRAVRITVRIPRTDRNLSHWPGWARKRLTPAWYERLDREGNRQSRTWWLYWGIIPPSFFTEIEVLKPWPQPEEQIIAAVRRPAG